MERERDDLAEDLGREAPERREAAARAAASVVGRRLRREHGGELVEVATFVVRPAARVDHFLEIRVVSLGGEIGTGAEENRPHSGLLLQYCL